jgi:Holliday junction DNA helicase RuvA
VLSGLTDEEFVRAVQKQDVQRLTRVPGVGKKTAERLIIELRDKLAIEPTLDVPATTSAGGDPVAEAVTALVALGYKPNEASQMVRGVAGPGLTTEQIIRQALKGVG